MSARAATWASGTDHDLLVDARVVTAAELLAAPHAAAATLDDVLPLLVAPDSGVALRRSEDMAALTDGTRSYPLRGDLPVLLPAQLHDYFTDRLAVPLAYNHDAFLQYFLLASIKQSGEINAAPDNVHYQRHLFRWRELCRDASGLVLDIGCDDPQLGAGLLSTRARYVGLDPFCQRPAPFRLIGVGEYVPFADATLDGVLLNTSLDHILDWRRALSEAWRVLVPGGRLYLSTLLWTDRADLVTDAVHFHHFRDYEIFSALDSFTVEVARRYSYKGDCHRHGLYLCARKEPALGVPA
ncbi:MAG: class I SAM-dependent methyltransferase [Alphaproteobacteria bacterium]